MIYEIRQPARAALTLECPFPEALAVLEGNNPGWVFVDDPNTPRAALVWAQGIEGFYLIGEPGTPAFLEELNDHIDRELNPRLLGIGVTWFEISGGENWDAVIERSFEKRRLERSQQWVYTLQPARQQAVLQYDPVGGCALLRIDQRLLIDFPVRNVEFLLARLERFWGGQEAFLKAGIGYVLVYVGEIASLCCSGFVTGDTHAVEIETVAAQRRKGYAQAAASAFIAECVERHYLPYWDCMAENTASARLAEKLGLTKSRTYNLYSFPL